MGGGGEAEVSLRISPISTCNRFLSTLYPRVFFPYFSMPPATARAGMEERNEKKIKAVKFSL
jgi:hypothetical protein